MSLRFILEIDGEVMESTTSYRYFIVRMRVILGIRFSHNVPALVVQTHQLPVPFCNVIVESDNVSVRFWVRRDNLYLIGYRMMTGMVLEFSRTENVLRLIPGSTSLGFDCSYGGLCGAAGVDLSQVTIGLHSLETAVQTLAVEERTQPRARSLIVAVVMFCESPRFIPVSEAITSSPDAEFRIPQYMVSLFRHWSNLSGALFRADAYPDERFTVPRSLLIPPNREIRTLADAISILGILLGLCYNRPRSMSLRLATLSDQQGQCFIGVPVLEVFSVLINYTPDDLAYSNLTGSIIISNGSDLIKIYNRTKNNPERVLADAIDLNGASQPLLAFGEVSIILKLIINDDTNDPFIDRTIWLDPINIGYEFDQRITFPVNSLNKGSVTVNCAVLRNAVAATVTVTLKEAYEGTSQVYGAMYAYYQGWENLQERITLFNVRDSDYVSVDRGRDIPLSRAALAVPLSAKYLRIDALLSDKDFLTGDDVIVKETLVFWLPDTLPFTSYIDSIEEGGNVVRVIVSFTTGY